MPAPALMPRRLLIYEALHSACVLKNYVHTFCTVAGLKVRVSPSLLHVSISLRVHHHIFYFPPPSYSLILAALDTHQLFHPSPQLHWESARTAPLRWQLHGSISV